MHEGLELSIRTAEESDLAAIHAIRRQAILSIRSHYSKVDIRQWADRRTPGYFAPQVQAGRVVLAELRGERVGWASFDQDKITGLYVAPTATGLGIGTHLMTEVETQIARSGYNRSHLAASLNAISFYERVGYEASGVAGESTCKMIKDLGTPKGI